MVLTALPLNSVGSVNVWQFDDVIEFTEGDPASVYFMLVDSTLDRSRVPAGRSYVPAAAATLTCAIETLDDTKKISRAASNPFPDDRSIWKLDFYATDSVRGTAGIRLTLTEGAVIRTGYAKNVLRIQSKTCL